MIVAERKPIEEVRTMVKDFKKVLTVGCGTCVAVCLAGGEKEVGVLNSELKIARRMEGNPIEVGGITVERQCDMEFLEELDGMVDEYDALVSMACGAGIQFLAERFPEIPVLPAVNTAFIGVNREVLVRGKMPGLRHLRAGHDGRHLPGNHVRQGPVQRPLRRHQQGQLRNQSRSAVCLVPDPRASGQTEPPGQHPGNLPGQRLAQPDAQNHHPTGVSRTPDRIGDQVAETERHHQQLKQAKPYRGITI